MRGDMNSHPWAALINATLRRHTWRATLPRRHVVLIRSGIIEGAGVIDRPLNSVQRDCASLFLGPSTEGCANSPQSLLSLV